MNESPHLYGSLSFFSICQKWKKNDINLGVEMLSSLGVFHLQNQ